MTKWNIFDYYSWLLTPGTIWTEDFESYSHRVSRRTLRWNELDISKGKMMKIVCWPSTIPPITHHPSPQCIISSKFTVFTAISPNSLFSRCLTVGIHCNAHFNKLPFVTISSMLGRKIIIIIIVPRSVFNVQYLVFDMNGECNQHWVLSIHVFEIHFNMLYAICLP